MLDPFLIQSLSSWQFSAGVNAPSIHMMDPPPPKVKTPYIIITEEGGGERADMSSRKEKAESGDVSIRVIGHNMESDKVIAQIAQHIYSLFEWRLSAKDFTVSGWSVVKTDCSIPQYIGNTFGYSEYSVLITITAYKQKET